MHDVGVNLRPDFFRLCQYLWGTFPFSRELLEDPTSIALDTVNISAMAPHVVCPWPWLEPALGTE